MIPPPRPARASKSPAVYVSGLVSPFCHHQNPCPSHSCHHTNSRGNSHGGRPRHASSQSPAPLPPPPLFLVFPALPHLFVERRRWTVRTVVTNRPSLCPDTAPRRRGAASSRADSRAAPPNSRRPPTWCGTRGGACVCVRVARKQQVPHVGRCPHTHRGGGDPRIPSLGEGSREGGDMQVGWPRW